MKAPAYKWTLKDSHQPQDWVKWTILEGGDCVGRDKVGSFLQEEEIWGRQEGWGEPLSGQGGPSAGETQERQASGRREHCFRQ